ncbi:flagellar protein FlaG [Shewanella eurypsychrophilus]|uniref:Flagellar protein FlaG n=1 Tax=Shewanella eurypsychrophilus TaxID=2593656 RepID=A0ABX6VGK6_9GAMM|nr:MULTISPECIES: flagellar protein FlaG [Shewanella]QFU25362.1 flagellar biosynthesis protein FlaG [Shewanella sp. YLB-09]QPG60503.1 flagellar protein FlaG [Shewanella eurypsychrophilus]
MDINVTGSPNGVPAKINIDTAQLGESRASSEAELDRRSIIQAVEDVKSSTAEPEAQSPEELEKLAIDLSDMMSVMKKGLAFRIDESSGQSVVSVLDIDSGDIIRQIPNEEALELAQKLSEVAGLLMKTEA